MISESFMGDNFGLEEIKKHYPYNVTLCKKEDIDEAIRSKKENTAYLVMQPCTIRNGVFYVPTVFDAVNTTLMSAVIPSKDTLAPNAYLSTKKSYQNLNSDTMDAIHN